MGGKRIFNGKAMSERALIIYLNNNRLLLENAKEKKIICLVLGKTLSRLFLEPWVKVLF